jgi:hypothetical protein
MAVRKTKLIPEAILTSNRDRDQYSRLPQTNERSIGSKVQFSRPRLWCSMKASTSIPATNLPCGATRCIAGSSKPNSALVIDFSGRRIGDSVSRRLHTQAGKLSFTLPANSLSSCET